MATYKDLKMVEILTQLRMTRLMMLHAAKSVESDAEMYLRFMNVYESILELSDYVDDFGEDSNDWD